LPMNKVEGKRVSAAAAYLTAKVRARKNLHIRPRTIARRILFHGRKVRGLEVEDPRGIHVIESSQLVLTLGALNTPALLVRSGVGPRADVERLGIPLVADVPAVGAQLLDHPGVAIFLRPRFGSGFRLDAPLLQTVLRYPATGSEHIADMQLQPGSKVPIPRFRLPLYSLMCAINKPRGVGTLRFVSADPRRKPIVESHFLEDSRDRAQAVEAMALAFRFAETPELRALAAHFWPSPRTLKDSTLLNRWISRACDSGYHASGTVPMGVTPTAAADGKGRVYGVEGVRVADASLMPTIPAANIHLTVLMMGERFGEWIRDET
jgi:choline dehydrogenase